MSAQPDQPSASNAPLDPLGLPKEASVLVRDEGERETKSANDMEGQESLEPLREASTDAHEINSKGPEPDNAQERQGVVSEINSPNTKDEISPANGNLRQIQAGEKENNGESNTAPTPEENEKGSDVAEWHQMPPRATNSQSLEQNGSGEISIKDSEVNEIRSNAPRRSILQKFIPGLKSTISSGIRTKRGTLGHHTKLKGIKSKERNVPQESPRRAKQNLLTQDKEEKGHHLMVFQTKEDRDRVLTRYKKFHSHGSYVARAKMKQNLDADPWYIEVEKPSVSLVYYMTLENQSILDITASVGHIVRGINEVHSKGLVLVDLCPSNFGMKEGIPFYWMVLRLNLAREVGETVSIDELRAICPILPPEVLKAIEEEEKEIKIDQSVDIWLLGALCCKMLKREEVSGEWILDPNRTDDSKLEVSKVDMENLLTIIGSMMHPEPRNRLTAKEICQKPIFL